MQKSRWWAIASAGLAVGVLTPTACGVTNGRGTATQSSAASVAAVASAPRSAPTTSPAHTAGGPAPRIGAALAYDPDRGVTVMFGGGKGNVSAPEGGLGDTWLWDGTRWLPQTPAASPPPRSFGAMAYEPNLHRIVLSGGGAANSDPIRSDTWAWDGTNWTDLTGRQPPSLMAHRLVYDDAVGRLVMLAGNRGPNGAALTTWTFDGANWSQLVTKAAPEPAEGIGMAYDQRAGVVVAFGGTTVLGPGGGRATTWLFDGSDWRQAHPPISPPPGQAVMAYDEGRGYLLLFSADGTTWTWAGSTWTRQTPRSSPGVRFFATMAYDKRAGQVVLFGGKKVDGTVESVTNETWTWSGSNWTLRP